MHTQVCIVADEAYSEQITTIHESSDIKERFSEFPQFSEETSRKVIISSYKWKFNQILRGPFASFITY